jgi:hypothetical protein
LRTEGATLLILSVLLYGLSEGSWLLFVLLFLLPDVSMLEYLSGSRVGAASYNLFHTYATPGLLAVLDLLTDSYAAVSVALVWFAPIGFDRRVGFGLSGSGEILLCYIAFGTNKVKHSYHKSDTPKVSQCNPEDHRDSGWVRLRREPFDYESKSYRTHPGSHPGQ